MIGIIREVAERITQDGNLQREYMILALQDGGFQTEGLTAYGQGRQEALLE